MARNEEANIARCLDALQDSNWSVTVLDSGSTDATRTIAREYQRVQVRAYDYHGHCRAYNEITTILGKSSRFVMVIDADMIVSPALQREIASFVAAAEDSTPVLVAEVQMYVEGAPLMWGSLYPPKALVFRVGRGYFVESGHGEVIQHAVQVAHARARLIHDDRKPYAAFLLSQERYAHNLVERAAQGKLTPRDRLRVQTPFLLLLVPWISYLLKGGMMSGRLGIIYALDRLIAEATMYRQALANKARVSGPFEHKRASPGSRTGRSPERDGADGK